MRFPGSQTDPAEVRLASLVLADHVVAAPVLLYGGVTLRNTILVLLLVQDRPAYRGTLLGVGRDPVAGLAVVVTFLDPFLDEMTADGVVPVLAALEAEDVAAATLDWPRLHVAHLDGVAAVRAGAPGEQPVALDKAVGDQVLVLQLRPGLRDQRHHGLVVHHDVAEPGTLDHLAGALVNDLGGEILHPAGGAVLVAALQARHHLPRVGGAADLALHHRPGGGGPPGLLDCIGGGRRLVGRDDLGLLKHGLLVL